VPESLKPLSTASKAIQRTNAVDSVGTGRLMRLIARIATS
jgi:hypothetical protein